MLGYANPAHLASLQSRSAAMELLEGETRALEMRLSSLVVWWRRSHTNSTPTDLI